MYDEHSISSESPSFMPALSLLLFLPLLHPAAAGTVQQAVQSAVGQLVGPGQSLAVVSIGAKPPGEASAHHCFVSFYLG